MQWSGVEGVRMHSARVHVVRTFRYWSPSSISADKPLSKVGFLAFSYSRFVTNPTKSAYLVRSAQNQITRGGRGSLPFLIM